MKQYNGHLLCKYSIHFFPPTYVMVKVNKLLKIQSHIPLVVFFFIHIGTLKQKHNFTWDIHIFGAACSRCFSEKKFGANFFLQIYDLTDLQTHSEILRIRQYCLSWNDSVVTPAQRLRVGSTKRRHNIFKWQFLIINSSNKKQENPATLTPINTPGMQWKTWHSNVSI